MGFPNHVKQLLKETMAYMVAPIRSLTTILHILSFESQNHLKISQVFSNRLNVVTDVKNIIQLNVIMRV